MQEPRSSYDRRSYRGLIGDLRASVRSYIAKQLLLPRQEVRELIVANLRAAMWIGAGLGFLALFLISLVVLLVALLAIVLPLWASALVVLLVFGVVSALLVYLGVKKLVLRGPERTIRSVKETITWVKATLLGRSAS